MKHQEKMGIEQKLKDLNSKYPFLLRVGKFCVEIALNERMIEVYIAPWSSPNKILSVLRATIDGSPDGTYSTVSLEDAILMLVQVMDALQQSKKLTETPNDEEIPQPFCIEDISERVTESRAGTSVWNEQGDDR